MKRSGFLKTLGLMVAAPSLAAPIPTKAERMASVDAAKVKSVAEKNHRRGVFEIEEITSQTSHSATVYLTEMTSGHLRVGDYLKCGKQIVVPTQIVRLSKRDMVVLQGWVYEPFNNEDTFLYTVYVPYREEI
jgi:hypothetical protein